MVENKVIIFIFPDEMMVKLFFPRRLEQENSPVVFCHNDMQEGNILMCMDQDKRNDSLEQQIVIIGKC